MAAWRTHQRLVMLVLAVLVAGAAQAQTRHADLTVSVTVVRSCSVAAPDRTGQPPGSASRGLLTVRCGRGAADAVAVGVGGEPGRLVGKAGVDKLLVGVPIPARAFVPARDPTGVPSTESRQSLLLTVDF